MFSFAVDIVDVFDAAYDASISFIKLSFIDDIGDETVVIVVIVDNVDNDDNDNDACYSSSKSNVFYYFSLF